MTAYHAVCLVVFETASNPSCAHGFFHIADDYCMCNLISICHQDRKPLTTPLEIPQTLAEQAEAQMKALESDPNLAMHESEIRKAQPNILNQSFVWALVHCQIL